MNKKADCDVGFIAVSIFIVLIITSVFAYTISVIWSQFGEECDEISFSKLISVDGRYDKDTGLFSGGSVSEKTLLFEDGLIITLDGWSEVPVELRLENYYSIRKCENNGGRIWYNLR